MADNANVTLGATVKYNPHLWGKDELRAIFVARTRELEDIVNRIRDTAPGRVPQHLLITGARGMGKSTLLHRIALAVSDDATLAQQWLPLVLPEEQYTVATLADLWFNVLGVLADTLEEEGENAQQLNQLGLQVAHVKTQDLAEQEAAALALLTDWIKRSGRRVVLLIDSTDQLFSSLSADAAKAATGSTQLWRLRNTLSHCPELFWIGASYQSLEASHHYTDAFHDFFELIELRPLSVAEMQKAMLALASTFGLGNDLRGDAAASAMARNLDARPERLKTLRAITGGNPRTTVILYDLFAASGQDDLHSDLKALLDSMTPLYKARMENLADQPRKILAHIMEHWAPIALGDLAHLSGIPNTTLSGQLKRLELDGLVEKTKLPGTRRSGYQVSERLFNIWYLMRYTSRWVRQKLTWLIEFMRLWYSTDELRGFAQARAQTHSQGGLREGTHLELSVAYATALPDDCRERIYLEHSVFNAVHELAKHQQQALSDIVPGLFDLDGNDHHFKTAEDYLLRFQSLDDKLVRCPHTQTEAEKQAWVLAVKQSISLSLAEKEHIAEAAETLSRFQYDELLTVYADAVIAWHNFFGKEMAEQFLQTVAQGRFFPDCPDSELAYRQIVSEFGDNPKIIAVCAFLLRSKHQDQWLEKTYRLWIKLDPNDASPWNGLGNLLQDHLNRYPEAEEAYNKAQQLAPQNPYPYANAGRLAAQLGETQHANDLYRQTAKLAAEPAELEQGIEYQGLLLQAQLWLNNQDAARLALDTLAQAASKGNNTALFRLREQVCEVSELGLGLALSELMASSRYADFLQPMILALRAADKVPDALEGAAAEIKSMAQEVLADILSFRKLAGS